MRASRTNHVRSGSPGSVNNEGGDFTLPPTDPIQPPTATATTTHNYNQRLTSSNVSDSGHLIFGLYPQHSNTLAVAPPQLGPESGSGVNRLDKKIFYEQPDGHFASATQEVQLHRQRLATQAQIDILRQQIPDFSPDDDAKTFAPFFLNLVVALSNVRRMVTGAAAGFSLLILIAIYWAPALEGVSVDINTLKEIANSTVGGAFGAQCLPETLGDCSSIVAYAAIYKATSYLFLVVSLLGTFLSLVPFTFDIFLMQVRERQSTVGGTTSLAVVMAATQQQQQQHQQQNQYAVAGAQGGSGINNNNNNMAAAAAGAGAEAPATGAYVSLRHLVTSTFPLFFVALVCCMAMSKVEVDRRTPARMVTITADQVSALRTSMILRSIVLIVAWLFSFRFTQPTAAEEIINSDVIGVHKS